MYPNFPAFFQKNTICNVFSFAVVFFLAINSQTIIAQCEENLVPNPSFEERNGCASGITTTFFPVNLVFDRVDDWIMPTGGTSDAFSTCNGLVPSFNNTLTSMTYMQQPVHGSGFAGIITLEPTNLYHEYIEVELKSSLIAGQEYEVVFYVSLADNQDLATEVQAHFSVDKLEDNASISVFNVVPQISSAGIVTDRDDWVQVSGSFIAAGGERFMTIGLFNESFTKISEIDEEKELAYYLIDQVSVQKMGDKVPVAGPSIYACPGVSTQLDASLSGGNSYVWTPATGLSNPLIANPVASPTTTTTYTVSVDYGGGCIKTDELTLSMADCSCNLNYSVIERDAKCYEGDGSMTASGSRPHPYSSISYQWTDVSGATIATTQTLRAPAGNYNVLITDEVTGCDQILSGGFGEPDPYSATITSIGNATCAGSDGEVQINIQGGTPITPSSVQYRLNFSHLSTNQSAFSNDYTLGNLDPGVYSVTISDKNNCDIVLPFSIGSDCPGCTATVDIGADFDACKGQDYILSPVVTGGTPVQYSWYNTYGLNGNTTNSSLVINDPNPTLNLQIGTSFTYTLVVDFGSGCTYSDNVTVTVVDDCTPPACPETVNAGVDVTINQGESTSLMATISGGVATYSWFPSSGVNDPTIPNPVVSPTTTTTYIVTADFGGGCVDTDTIEVNVMNPGCTIALDDTNINLMNTDCGQTNGSITGINISGNSGSETYRWTDISGLEVGTSINLIDIGQGDYSLTVTEGSCSDTVGPFKINEDGAPTLNDSSITISNSDCGQTNGSITGINISGNSGSESYSWTDTDNNQIANTIDLIGVGPGSYLLTLEQGSCTTTSGPYLLRDKGAPVLNDSAIDIIDANCNDNDGSIAGITITDNSGNESYSWADQNGTVVGSSIILNSIPAGVYTLTVTDQGCNAIAGPYFIDEIDNCQEPEPESIRIATAMTPNGDNSNDMFMIRGLENYPNNRLYIFNRWGNKVYEASNYQNNWYGNYQNKPLPVATYYYILELNDTTQQVYKGAITIIR